MGENGGSSIVWDGDSDIRTMNIFAPTDLTSLKFGDPTDLALNVTLNGDDAASFLVRLIFSLDLSTSTEQAGWQTFAEASSPLFAGSAFTEGGLGDPSNNIDAHTVALTIDFVNVGAGLYAIPDPAAVAHLFDADPNAVFYVGIAARINNQSLDSGAFATFEVQSGGGTGNPVPEPSTLMLLGTGALALYRRRRAPQA